MSGLGAWVLVYCMLAICLLTIFALRNQKVVFFSNNEKLTILLVTKTFLIVQLCQGPK